METPTPPPPRLDLPPILTSPPQIPTSPPKPKGFFQRMWVGLLTFIAAFWKYAYFAFKLAKGGKLLLTAGTMLLSIAVYSRIFGWWFALGFVICIFIHEMGHVFAAWRLKMPVSAPIFIPFMGAVILTRGSKNSGWENAIVGIGGPAFGALSGFGCWGLYTLTGMPIFLGLAYTAFFINLFNMLPMYPLDGGWITGAVSPYIWIVGMVALVGLLFTGQMHNIFIWLIILLSLPQIVRALKSGTMDSPGYRTTGKQKLTMGVAYLSLCGVLIFGMVQTMRDPARIHRVRVSAGQPTVQ